MRAAFKEQPYQGISAPEPRKAAAAAAALFCASFILYLLFGMHDLWDPEAMYAEVPREMLLSGDFLYPTLNYAPFLYKPPLYLWANAAAMALFGHSVLALRMPLAAFAAGTVVITFLIGRRLSLRAGIFSGAVLTTSFGFAFHTAMLLPDFPLTFFVAASVLFFIKAINGEKGAVTGVYASLALAVMTKGFIGLVFPVAAFLAWMALERRWDTARRFASAPGVAAFLLITVPWHVLMEMRNPGFLYNYIVNEQVLRFFNKRFPPDWDSVTTPLFIPITLGWLMPWAAFLFQASTPRRYKEAGTPLKLAYLWGLSGMLFLALSSSKMEYYCLPLLPAFAIVIGCWWAGLSDRKAVLSAGIGALALAAFAAGGLAVLKPLEGVMKAGLNMTDAGASGLVSVAAGSFAILLGGGLLVFSLLRRGRIFPAFYALLASAVLFTAASRGMLEHITPSLSNAEAAKAVAKLAGPGDLVVVDGVQEYEYSTTCCFYLKDRIVILSNGGRPVLSARQVEDGGFILDDGKFREAWQSDGKRVFFITERDPASGGIAGIPDGRFRRVFEKAGRRVFVNI